MTSLLNELTEVNGIIKPSGDNDFTCAHRTIQEYFAACEAHINCEKEDVLPEFSGRDDLIKVLYFYCGLIHNVKDASYILKELIEFELLSSVSLKKGKAFDKIRTDFHECIDSIISTDTKVSALESVLSTDPDTAMKLMPGFLKHSSVKWKKSAVKLLKNIDTDEALNRLLGLLNPTT